MPAAMVGRVSCFEQHYHLALTFDCLSQRFVALQRPAPLRDAALKALQACAANCSYVLYAPLLLLQPSSWCQAVDPLLRSGSTVYVTECKATIQDDCNLCEQVVTE